LEELEDFEVLDDWKKLMEIEEDCYGKVDNVLNVIL